MISPGKNITLRPYKIYKDDHSKDVPVGFGKDIRGNFLKFQLMDVNTGVGDKKNIGYCYVNVYTDLPLKVGDMIQIDKILYVQVKRMGYKQIFVIGVEIMQTNPSVIVEQFESEDFGEINF